MSNNSKLKETFYHYIKCEFDVEKIKKYAIEENITIDGYRSRVYYYYAYLATEEEKKLYDETKISFNNSYIKKFKRFNNSVNNVLSLVSIEEQSQYLFNRYQTRSIKKFKDDILFYSKNLNEETLKKLNNLCNLLEIYNKNNKDSKKTQKKYGRKKKQLSDLKDFIDKIMNLIKDDKFNLDDFLMQEKMSKTTFNNNLNLIKENDLETYNIINNYLKKAELIKDKELLQVAKKILLALKNGIIVNNEQIPFTMLEYYMITKENLDIIKNTLIKYNFSQKDIDTYNYFLSRHSINSKILISDSVIYEEHRFIKEKNDLREITREEKEKTVAFLEENNIPIVSSVYGIALKRQAQNSLSTNIEFGTTELKQERIIDKSYRIH